MSTIKVDTIQNTSGVVRRGIQTYAIISDEKSNNTHGGSFSNGAWRTRDLNSEIVDPDNIVSVSSNQFTLGAGSYLIQGSAPVTEVDRHQIRLYDITNNAVVEYGTSQLANSGNSYNNDRSFVDARVVITGNTVYEIQHQCERTKASFGFGLSVNFGGVEHFTRVEIYKEA